jgi:hypothetical protein
MSEEKSYPSLPEQGQNLAKFIFDVIKTTWNGDHLTVSDEVYEERLNVCRTCEWYDESQNRCRHCGCFLREKARYSIDSCPIKKWGMSDKEWVENKFNQVMDIMNRGESDIELDEEGNEVIHFPVDVEEGTVYEVNGKTYVYKMKIVEEEGPPGYWHRIRKGYWDRTIL